MSRYLAMLFGGSLAFTVLIELAVVFLVLYFGREREKLPKILLLSVPVNALTNPLAVLICLLGKLFLRPVFWFPLQLAVEMAVVTAEGFVYSRFAARPEWEMRRPWLLAVSANVCSWLLGLFVL